MPVSRSAFLRILGLLADQVFTFGTVFLANIVLARAVPAVEYGAFVLVYSVFTLIAGFHNAVVLEAFTVFAASRYREVYASYWRHSFRLNLIASFGGGGALVVSALLFALVFSEAGAFDYAVFGIVMPVLLTSLFARRSLFVEGRTTKAGLMAIAYFVIVSGSLWVALETRTLSVVTVLAILALGWVLVIPVFFVGRFRNLSGGNFLITYPEYMTLHWRYSKWVLLTALVVQFSAQAYFWLTGLLLGKESVAGLRAAWNIMSPMLILLTSLSTLMLPRLSRFVHDQGRGGASLQAELFWYGLLASAVAIAWAIFLWLFGDQVYSVVYGGSYANSVGLLYILALIPPIVTVGNVLVDALRAMEEPRLVFIAFSVSGAITLAAGVPAILRFHESGAAWSMVASNVGYTLTLVVCYLWVCRRQKARMRQSE
jgi:O-antigen/teichoic acid export membrane protein